MSNTLKGLLVLVAASVFGVIFLELAGAVTYRLWRGEWPNRREIQARLLIDRVDAPEEGKEADAPRDAAVPDQPVVLHPYFGFVINPSQRGINELGFFDISPLEPRRDNELIVVFFGGSVADQVYYMGQGAFVAALEKRPDLRGREVRVVSTAVGGYKQPQQMLVLSMLLSLGAEIDVVVNLDGFNEIDSAMDNAITGINPFYPHNWKLHSRKVILPEANAALGRIAILREERKRLRTLFSRPVLDSSTFLLTLWDFLDGGREVQIREQTATLEGLLDSEDLPPQVRGPKYKYLSASHFYTEMTALWGRSSLNMARLCQEYGVVYVHALQPNQYLPESKVLTEEEQEIAYDRNFTGLSRVPVGYPLLIEEGRRLHKEFGVNFLDLTQIYADEKRSIYSDFCCHVNQLGANLMAEAIAEGIPQLP